MSCTCATYTTRTSSQTNITNGLNEWRPGLELDVLLSTAVFVVFAVDEQLVEF